MDKYLVGIDPGRHTGVVIALPSEPIRYEHFTISSRGRVYDPTKFAEVLYASLIKHVMHFVDGNVFEDVEYLIEVPLPVRRSLPALLIGLPGTAYLVGFLAACFMQNNATCKLYPAVDVKNRIVNLFDGSALVVKAKRSSKSEKIQAIQVDAFGPSILDASDHIRDALNLIILHRKIGISN